MKQNISPKDVQLISVVIPAYKAEKYIRTHLINVMNVLNQVRYPYEIICVVDGQLDNTQKEAEKVSQRYSDKVKVTGYLTNLGKGHAVRFGMAQAKGDIIGFTDVGRDLNVNGLSLLLEHFNWYSADIIVGSKRHPASKVTYPWQRRILSIVYQIIVRLLFGLKVRDTQVGMKFFRREVLEKVLPRVLVKEFAFDIEILAVANYLGYTKIYEAPIELSMEFSSSTIVQKGFLRQVFNMTKDTLAVFYRLNILHYYDDKNKKRWITPDYLMLKTKSTT